jgi:hypothetical protein
VNCFVGQFTEREFLFSRADAEIGDWLRFAVNARGTALFSEIRAARIASLWIALTSGAL